jgi:hypothetical protein
LVRDRPLPQRGTFTSASELSAKLTSAGEALASCAPSGMPWPSTTTIYFVPLPRLVGPTPAPPFSRSQSCRPGRFRPTGLERYQRPLPVMNEYGLLLGEVMTAAEVVR